MLFTLNSSAQIENVVTPTVICTGKVFTVTFDVSNKGNTTSYFTADSEYKLDLGTLSGTGNSFVSDTVIASGLKYTGVTYTTDNNTTYQISFDVVMPSTVVANADHAISVSSLNPAYNDKKGYSNTFEVVETPVTTATNSGSYCDTATIHLFSTEIADAIFSWTGPNGYTSDVANPTIPNATPAMSGVYNVTATNLKGCTSLVSTTNVFVTNNITWTGANSPDWHDASNWSCHFLPKSTSNVIIPTGLSRYPVLNSGENGFAKNITIEDGASVEINGGNLELAGDLLNNGVLNAKNGSIAFVGEIPQKIVSGEFQVENLNINNAGGVTSEAIIELIGSLTVETGNFYTGDQFTLVSSETKTALIDSSGDGKIIGLVKMQRYLVEAFGYKYFSSPFQNSIVGDFNPFMDLLDPDTNFPHFYRYDENRREEGLDQDATGWEAYIDPAGTLNIAEGYTLNFGHTYDPVTVELEGEVNNGGISKNLQHNNREWTKGFNLVGNPYPSPINWNASGWTKENIDDGIYFFTAGNNQYTGTYTSYVNGTSNDGKSTNIIPSMQGFFVKVSDPEIEGNTVIATLGMTNEIRIADFEQKFLRAPQSQTKPLLRLKAGFENTESTDAMVVYFSPSSSPGFEKEMDAHKLMNTDVNVPNIYSISRDQKELSINALPMPVSGGYEKLPLGIIAEQNGRMTISLADVEYLPSGFNIYLIDLEKKIGQNLNQKPEYSFNISEGIDNSRFQLMFSEEKMNDRAIAFDELFSVKMNLGSLTVKLNLEEDQKGNLQLSTITGQVLEEKEGHGKEQVKFSTINSSGVYFINLYVGEQRISKKVLIKL